MEKVLRAAHATADQHDYMDYHVTGGPQVAGNRSPTGGRRAALFTFIEYTRHQ